MAPPSAPAGSGPLAVLDPTGEPGHLPAATFLPRRVCEPRGGSGGGRGEAPTPAAQRESGSRQPAAGLGEAGISPGEARLPLAQSA